MILSDIEIRAEIQAGRLRFEPQLILDGEHKQLHVASMDLRLGMELREFKPEVQGVQSTINLSQLEWSSFLQEYTAPIQALEDAKGRYIDLRPGKLLLARTLESVTLPAHLAAWIEGRSLPARIGLTVHNTAPFIHPGFQGHIYLEMFHHGNMPIRVYLGEERLSQLIIERIGSPPLELYTGRFAGQ